MDISEFNRLSDQKNYQRHPWETSRKNVLKYFLNQTNIKFPIDRIVDIGSGDAFVIHSLLANNFATEYFAIDTAYNEEIINQLKANNKNSQVQYLSNLGEYYANHDTQKNTLFLCMDVLEHTEDEKIILDFLQNETGNYFFFAVPAFQKLFSNHDILLGHYRRYSLPELENLLNKNNFKILDKGYYFFTLLALRWLEKSRKKDQKESIDNWEGGKFKTDLINFVLKTDFKIIMLLKKLNIRINGLSCYCLCTK